MFNASAFGRNWNPFSKQFRDALIDMANTVAELASVQSQVMAMLAKQSRVQDEPYFYAKITGHAGGISCARWSYSWIEVIPSTSTGTCSNTDYDNLSGGRTGTDDAFNAWESANTNSTAYGFGVVGTGGGQWFLAASPFTGMEFKPVPTNTVVMMRTVLAPNANRVRFEFCAPNPIDGECEPSVEPSTSLTFDEVRRINFIDQQQ